jgi:hypothetical protein
MEDRQIGELLIRQASPGLRRLARGTLLDRQVSRSPRDYDARHPRHIALPRFSIASLGEIYGRLDERPCICRAFHLDFFCSLPPTFEMTCPTAITLLSGWSAST